MISLNPFPPFFNKKENREENGSFHTLYHGSSPMKMCDLLLDHITSGVERYGSVQNATEDGDFDENSLSHWLLIVPPIWRRSKRLLCKPLYNA